MKHIVKHGADAPKLKDLDEYQLGWSDNKKTLYIKANNNIIPCVNSVNDSHTFIEKYTIDPTNIIDTGTDSFKICSKELSIFGDIDRTDLIGNFYLAATENVGDTISVFLIFKPAKENAALNVSAYIDLKKFNKVEKTSEHTADFVENIVLTSDSYAIQLFDVEKYDGTASFEADIILKIDTSNFVFKLQTQIDNSNSIPSYSLVKGELTYGKIGE